MKKVTFKNCWNHESEIVYDEWSATYYLLKSYDYNTSTYTAREERLDDNMDIVITDEEAKLHKYDIVGMEIF